MTLSGVPDHIGETGRPEAETRDRLRRRGEAVLLLLFAFIPLAPTLTSGFVYDDHILIEDWAVGDGRPPLLEAIGSDLFGSDPEGHALTGYYRPVISFFYWVETLAFGDSPSLYHLVNILIFAGVCLLFFRLLLRIELLRDIALPAALIFAVLPVHCESLAPISGRTDPLATLFALLAAHAALSLRKGPCLIWLGLSVFSKESAVVFVPLVAATALLSQNTGARRASLHLLIGGVLLAAALFLIKIPLLGIVPPDGAYVGEGSTAERFLTFIAVIPEYLALLVWPSELSIVHEVDLVTTPGDPRLWVGLAVLSGLLLLLRARSAALRYGSAVFLLTLLPASAVVPFTYVFKDVEFPLFERYLFVPSLGFSMLVGWSLLALARVGRPGRQSLLACAFATLLAIPYAVREWSRSSEWKDDVTLYSAALGTVSDTSFLKFHLANAHLRQGDVAQAVATYEELLKDDPGNPEGLVFLGNIYTSFAQSHFADARQHDLEELPDGARHLRERGRELLESARQLLRQRLEEDPTDSRALEGLGTAAAVEGNYLAAAKLYNRAWNGENALPSLPENYRQLAQRMSAQAKAIADQGASHLDQARGAYESSVQALTGGFPPDVIPDPIREVVLTMLARHADDLVLANHLDGARQAYLEILRIDPGQYRCHEGLGYVAKQTGDRPEAFRRFKLALELEPDAFVALNEMFTMLQEEGRTAEADLYLKRLQDLLDRNVDRRKLPPLPGDANGE